MHFLTHADALDAIRTFEDSLDRPGYAYRFTTTTTGRIGVLIYSDADGALLGVL